MIKHRSDHSLHSFLLQLYVLLQAQHRITVTVGHYPGSINVYSDAASRKFRVPHGKRYQQELSLLPLLPYLNPLNRDIVAIGNKPSANTSSLAPSALPSLVGVHGWIMRETIGLIQH